MIAWIVFVISVLLSIHIARKVNFKRAHYNKYAWAVLQSMSWVGATYNMPMMGGLGARGWMRHDRIFDHVSDTIENPSRRLVRMAVNLLERQGMIECEQGVYPGTYDYRMTKVGSTELHRLDYIVPEGRDRLRKFGILKD